MSARLAIKRIVLKVFNWCTGNRHRVRNYRGNRLRAASRKNDDIVRCTDTSLFDEIFSRFSNGFGNHWIFDKHTYIYIYISVGSSGRVCLDGFEGNRRRRDFDDDGGGGCPADV